MKLGAGTSNPPYTVPPGLTCCRKRSRTAWAYSALVSRRIGTAVGAGPPGGKTTAPVAPPLLPTEAPAPVVPPAPGPIAPPAPGDPAPPVPPDPVTPGPPVPPVAPVPGPGGPLFSVALHPDRAIPDRATPAARQKTIDPGNQRILETFMGGLFFSARHRDGCGSLSELSPAGRVGGLDDTTSPARKAVARRCDKGPPRSSSDDGFVRSCASRTRRLRPRPGCLRLAPFYHATIAPPTRRGGGAGGFRGAFGVQGKGSDSVGSGRAKRHRQALSPAIPNGPRSRRARCGIHPCCETWLPSRFEGSGQSETAAVRSGESPG